MNQLQIKSGAPSALRAAAALTNAYVSSTGVDLQSYDSVSVTFAFSATDAGRTCTVKYQWSNDNVDYNWATGVGTAPTNWFNETIEGAGTASGAELASASSIRTTTIDMSQDYRDGLIMRFHRLGRHFRIMAKADSSTTATLAVTALPMCNQN